MLPAIKVTKSKVEQGRKKVFDEKKANKRSNERENMSGGLSDMSSKDKSLLI